MVQTGNSLFQRQTDESLERNVRGIHTISCLAGAALSCTARVSSKMHTLYLWRRLRESTLNKRQRFRMHEKGSCSQQ